MVRTVGCPLSVDAKESPIPITLDVRYDFGPASCRGLSASYDQIRIRLISFHHGQPWRYQRTRPPPASYYLPFTLHHRSSRSYDTSSGATLSLPPHYASSLGVSQQPNPATQATLTEHWTKLILSYSRFRRLFVLRVEDAETGGGDWDEVLRNPRINRACVSHTEILSLTAVLFV